MRVLKSEITQKSSYEFFAGLDGNSSPTWTGNVSSRKPVFEDKVNGVMRTSVIYNAGIKRYLLTTQTVSRYSNSNFHIGIYDAPEPWGPWTTVLLKNAAESGLIKQGYWKTVFFNFSNKWTSSDGKNWVMVYTDEDNWATMEGVFTLNDGTTGALKNRLYEKRSGHSLQVFPNPVHSNAFIRISNNRSLDKISLFNLQGRLMYNIALSGANRSFSLNVHCFPPGQYTVQAICGGQSLHQKVLLTK
jgi:hypothetical protein